MPGRNLANRSPFSFSPARSLAAPLKMHGKDFVLVFRRSWRDPGFMAATALALAYGILFSYLSILKHQTLNSTAFDLGFFDQALWNTLQGRVLQTSLVVASPGHTSYFAEHISPILLPLSLLYLLKDDVRVLLVFQAFATGFSALPLYLLARLRCGSRATAVVLSAAYLALPTIVLNNLFDFHPDMLIVPLLPLAFYLIHTRRYRSFVLATVTMLAIKETMAISIFALALYAGIRMGQRLIGLALAIGSLVWLFLSVDVIVPYFRGGVYHQLSRYQEVGGSIGGIALNAINEPSSLINLLLQPYNFAYLVTLLIPLAGLPILSPIEAAVALPMLLVNMLSSGGMQANLAFQYSLPVASLIFIATIESVRRIERRFASFSRRVNWSSVVGFGLALLVVELTTSTTGSILFQPDSIRERFTAPPNAANIAAAAALISPDASLATSNKLAPQFAHREQLRLFPPLEVDDQLQSIDSEYILVNLDDNRWSGIPEDRLSGANSTNELVARLIDPGSYELIYSQGDIVLFRRR